MKREERESKGKGEGDDVKGGHCVHVSSFQRCSISVEGRAECDLL